MGFSKIIINTISHFSILFTSPLIEVVLEFPFFFLQISHRHSTLLRWRDAVVSKFLDREKVTLNKFAIREISESNGCIWDVELWYMIIGENRKEIFQDFHHCGILNRSYWTWTHCVVRFSEAKDDFNKGWDERVVLVHKTQMNHHHWIPEKEMEMSCSYIKGKLNSRFGCTNTPS